MKYVVHFGEVDNNRILRVCRHGPSPADADDETMEVVVLERHLVNCPGCLQQINRSLPAFGRFVQRIYKPNDEQ